MKPNALAKLTWVLVATIIIAWASQARAQGRNISGNIKGTLGGANAGPCASGYANQCSNFNATPCEHFTPVGTPKITGNFGVGTITSMCITVDPGNNVNEPNDLDAKKTCSPVYGDLTSSTTRKGKTTITDVNFAGVFCHHQANSPVGTLEGGFGIEGQDTDASATGWGTLTGTVNKDSQAMLLKLRGSLTP